MISLFHMDFFNGGEFDGAYRRLSPLTHGPSIGFFCGKTLKFFLENYKHAPWEQSDSRSSEILNEPLDFIGRFENLEEDFKKLCEHIGVDLDLPHKGSTKRKAYAGYYDDETRQMVADMFSEDISQFEYTFEE